MARCKLAAILAGVSLWAFGVANTASAQQMYAGQDLRAIDAGTNITVRTNGRIHAERSDGRIFTGVVEQDILDRQGGIIIPKGSDVELVVRRLSDNDFVLDIDSAIVNGDRYGIESEGGAGEVIGTIVGVITGLPVLTRGSVVDVPDESLLTFHLSKPLREGIPDKGYVSNGFHYHHGYGAERYETQQARQKPGAYSNGQGAISIGTDKNISWQGQESGNVYVQVDNQEPALFSSGQSGVEPAQWMSQGHLYVFTLQDANGNVIARDQLDLR
jgi:hypothetical protein